MKRPFLKILASLAIIGECTKREEIVQISKPSHQFPIRLHTLLSDVLKVSRKALI